jgi:predicted RNase H-like nuclease
MNWVAGVDGCRAGWLVVLLQRKGRRYEHEMRLCHTFAEVLALEPQPEIIAIDMPIGLLDKPQPGGRECDQQARKLLGRRASSIFSPPARLMLKATRYEQVRAQGLSIQAFNILPKIREVDQLMTLELQEYIHEAAPELAFMSLAGASMRYSKKTREGREERQKILAPLFHRKGEKSPFTSPFGKGNNILDAPRYS